MTNSTAQDEDGFPIGANVSGAERKAAREAAVADIDMTPSPKAYREMLEIIKRDGAAQVDREWAAAELERVANVTSWRS